LSTVEREKKEREREGERERETKRNQSLYRAFARRGISLPKESDSFLFLFACTCSLILFFLLTESSTDLILRGEVNYSPDLQFIHVARIFAKFARPEQYLQSEKEGETDATGGSKRGKNVRNQEKKMSFLIDYD
jgi:hypothetical protein